MKTPFEGLAPGTVGIKICGITNPDDLEMCLDLGVDALGFNFYPGSKRFLEMEKERNWLGTVPDSVYRVAVVVNPSRDEALALLSESFIDALQLHGDENLAFCEELAEASGEQIIKAVRVENVESLAGVEEFVAFPVLLDAFAGHERGGTGKTFDWKILQNLKTQDRIILSGGLNPENIASALRLTKVRYVDVASGVENDPRRKSREKVGNFVAQVRKSLT